MELDLLVDELLVITFGLVANAFNDALVVCVVNNVGSCSRKVYKCQI